MSVGTGFAAVGIALLGYGLRRQVLVDRLIDEGRFAPPDPRVLVALTAAGLVLGMLTIVLLATSL